MKWEVLGKDNGDVVKTLLKNRGIKEHKEFFNPTNPARISIESLGIKKSDVKRTIERIKKAKKDKENVVIYGDYDADGITATAIMWEALNEYGLKVLPHIPDRFEEGYGINEESVKSLKLKIPDLSLIVTVDNGVIAHQGIKTAKNLGIDVIVIDHHQKDKKILPTSYLIHSTEVCGSALSWFFVKEFGIENGLDLAAIGTVADQMPLVGVNRSIVKFGLEKLSSTKRPGLSALFKEAKIEKIGTYEVNYIIAPRINAMGRLAQGIDSLRLLCTRRVDRALELSRLLSKTNVDRQKIVESVVFQVKGKVKDEKIIVLAHEDYHEGVIGLAAGKLVEEFYRPAIVLSKKGKTSKASARSISGFNIIEAIRSTGLILEGGGHPMAAGFSIETHKIKMFTKKINLIADKLLTKDLLQKNLKIDTKIDFKNIGNELNEQLKKFNPTGLGNPTPTFMTEKVEVVDARTVGNQARHLKIRLRQDEHIYDSIFFGGGEFYSDLTPDIKIDVAFQIEENVWNGRTSLQLKIKDIHPLKN